MDLSTESNLSRENVRKVSFMDKKSKPNNKAMRQTIHQKYGGRCAYCGEEIKMESMHIDHLKPIYRGNPSVNPAYRGPDDISNMMPACRVCNLWKSVWSLEDFRSEISAQVDRLRQRSANFRIAEKYGMVVPVTQPVVFWFEQLA